MSFIFKCVCVGSGGIFYDFYVIKGRSFICLLGFVKEMRMRIEIEEFFLVIDFCFLFFSGFS